MKSQNTKSSDQLKKEVDKELHNVKRDLKEMEGRLSPGQIIDDAIFYPQGRSLGATLDHLKRNPVGTTFLSLGTILLMEDESHRTYEASTKDKISSARSSLNEKVSSVKASVKEHIPLRDKSIETGPSKSDVLKEKVRDFKADLTDKTEDLKSSVEQSVSSAKDTIQDKFHSDSEAQFGPDAGAYDGGVSAGSGIDDISSGSKTRNFKDKAMSTASDAVKSGKELYTHGLEQAQNLDPMVYMALGAGLGALTGAGLPVSQKEEEIFSDKFSAKFSSISEDLQEAINESSNILKDLVIGDVKDINFKVIR